VQLDDLELLVGQAGRLLEDGVRNGELADVVDERSGRERAAAGRRYRPSSSPTWTAARRHAARVLLRVLVLAGSER
jgi:hypothetical protein